MIYILGFSIILFITIVFTVYEIGYPKYGWFKNILHDKYHLHVSDFENQLDYDIKTKIVYTSCKYCHEPMIYTGICKHLVVENPSKIPDSVYDSYCRQCISKNYTNNKQCCPLKCSDMGICNMCERK